MSEIVQTSFQSFKLVEWVQQASYWQLPPHQPATSDQDAFMLGGNGRVSARMGMQKDYSTIDRFMGPEYDSYGYHQNNYFRRSEVGISREHPHECITEHQRLWRVPGTAIMCSWESVRVQHERDVWFRGIEIVTVNFVLPDTTALLRLIAVKNNSYAPVNDIRLVLDAVPDVPWPKPGHCSEIRPYKGGRLIEKVTEFARLENPGPGEYFSKEIIERYRYCIHGLLEGENRGFEQLASEVMNLQCGQEKVFLAYLAVSPDGTVESAEKVEAEIMSEVKSKGFFAPLERTRAWWQKWIQDGTAVTCPEPAVADFLDAATVHQKQAEHHTGGFMVGDDYTQCFIRDCNGSHHWLLDTGHPEEVRRSMEFFFRMDAECGNFQNSYELDLGKSFVEPKPPYWFDKDQGKKEIIDWIVSGHKETNPAEIKRHEFLTPGDVPNFRVLWYWHYHRRTGDLSLIEKRWSYLRALIRLQDFERFEYLAGWSRDETYGIGPVGPLRRGNSADNSFIALAAVRSLVTLARRLNKKADAEELQALADKIHHAIETRLWIDSDGLYAMRITPEGELDPRACSPGLLRPLYAGSAGPEDDHAAKSVEFVLKHMMMQPGFIRIIPGDYYTTCGHFPAYMLVDLCKLDHPGATQAFRDLMIYVNPAGTCAEYYDLSSPAPKPHMHRTRNWETGLDADAVLYYLTGFEPDAYAKQFFLKPHLPPDWNGFTVRRMHFGSSLIDLDVKRVEKGIHYSVSHSGSQPVTMNGKFILPDANEAIKMKVDGKSVDAPIKTGRYGVKCVEWEAVLQPNGRIEIQLGE